ncbi:MAG: Hpt domain-containing protein [Burkholderiaceae bacterium]
MAHSEARVVVSVKPVQPTAGFGKAAAIVEHFDGDAALYDAFAASCAGQFATDAAAGQSACETGDLQALGALAHNLKSALLMLGHTELSDLAARVDMLAAACDLASARVPWRALLAGLVRLQSP